MRFCDFDAKLGRIVELESRKLGYFIFKRFDIPFDRYFKLKIYLFEMSILSLGWIFCNFDSLYLPTRGV